MQANNFDTIDGYYLIKKIGEGGYGVAYLVKNDADEYFVLKLIRPDTPSHMLPSRIASFRNEYNMQKDLSHENIVKLTAFSENGVWKSPSDYVKHENVVYLVSENCPRGELFDIVMSHQGLSEKEGRFFFNGLIQGLEYMKQKGIYHRDLKMENLFIDENFNLKIGDFGFATDKDITKTY